MNVELDPDWEQDMITVRQLIEHAELSCTLISGATGLDNQVRWAHLSELEDPTRWLQGKELLMTTGMAIPEHSVLQVEYLRRLAEIEVSGVAIGTGMHAPRLSEEMLQASEDLRVPLLEVSGGVPFIAISETVALANRDALHRRLTTHLRTYQVLGEASEQPMATGEIVRRLEQVTGFRIWTVTRTGASLFDDIDTPPFPLPEGIIDEVMDGKGAGIRYPSEVSLPSGGGAAHVLPIRVHRQPIGVLVTRPEDRREPDLLSMHHLVTILSYLAGDLLKLREQARREGSEKLARMLYESEQQRNVTIGDIFVADDKLTSFCFAVVAFDERAVGWDELHNYLLEHGFDHCMTNRGERGAIAVHLGSGTVETLARVLTRNLPESVIGLSGPASGETDLLVCQRQARWALRSAVAEKRSLELYVDAPAPRWLPVESSGLELIVEGVLGPLESYDSERGTELVHTLISFLEENRSWKATADKLYIHRQTLIGRINRIETLTGRSLTSTEDVCDLWLAIKAREILQRSGMAALDD